MSDSAGGDVRNIAFDAVPGGTRFRVRVQPRASRTELAGEFAGALRVRVAAPPVEGAANLELTRFLAKRLGCPRRNVTLIAGETGRSKLVEVRGLDPAEVVARLG